MHIFILILATYRIANLLADEPGPLDVFDRLRDFLGVGYDEQDRPYGPKLARGILCVKCNSVWLGAGWALLHYLLPDLAFWLALPLALSAGAMFINQVIE